MHPSFRAFLLCACLLLTACGGGSGGSSAPSAAGGDTSPVPGGTGGDAPPPPVLAVAVVPQAVTLDPGAAQDFRCTVSGTAIAGCSWRVAEGAAGGQIDGTGHYQAPAAAGVYHVQAASLADPAVTATVAVTVRAAQAALPWVTGYYAGYYWPVGEFQAPEHVDMTAMTHLVFARVAPGGGTLGGQPGQVVYGAGSAGDPNQGPGAPVRSVEDFLIARAHAAGTRALLMVGGMGDGDGFIASTDAARRPTFVKNLVDYLVAHDYDGVDIDWEDQIHGPTEQGQLIALLRELRAAANARPRYQNKPVLITFPGYALNMNTDTVEPWKVTVAGLVDQYNLMSYGMAYDAYGWSTWHFCAITGQDGSHPMDLSSSIQAYVDAGVPRGKLGIGIGFYGINYAPPASGPRQPIPAGVQVQNDDNEWAYANLSRYGYLSHGTYHWDAEAQASYRVYPGGYQPAGRSKAGYLAYEDEASIAAKGAWVRSTGVGGTIIWLVNYGTTNGRDNPLLGAVKQAFLQ
jgi:chitinase